MSEQSTDHIYLQSVPRPVAAMAKSYPANYAGYRHSHERAQLLYAASGTMKLLSDWGCWIIPQQRAAWIPAGYPHQIASIGPMKMRTLYIRGDACPSAAPQEPRMLAVSGLLRELILRATKMPIEYDEQGHDGNLITALLGEIDWAPLHPVSLPPSAGHTIEIPRSRSDEKPWRYPNARRVGETDRQFGAYVKPTLSAGSAGIVSGLARTSPHLRGAPLTGRRQTPYRDCRCSGLRDSLELYGHV